MFDSKTISRRFYRRILLTSWKRKIRGLCEYVRVRKVRNITGRKCLTLVPPSGEKYLILNFYAFQGVCLN